MKINRTKLFALCLTMGIIAALILSATSCSSKTTAGTLVTTAKITTSSKPTPILISLAVQPDAPPNLVAGSTMQFTAVGTYSDNTTADLSTQATWTSSSTATATIATSGVATGVAPGSTNITAALSGKTSTSVAVTVVPASALTSIVIKPAAPAGLAVGSTQQFNVTGTYADNSTADVTTKATWTSSDPNIASISSSGFVTAHVQGSVDLTAKVSGITSASVKLTVAPPSLSAINIVPATPDNLGVGLTVRFTASGTFSDDSTADVTAKVTWSSSNPNIASISSTGLATGLAAGNTNITAALSGITSQIAILPVATLTSVAIAPASPADLLIGTTQPFKATGTYSNGVTSLITVPVTWSSSNTGVAKIASTGIATGIAAGSTDISFTLSGFTSPTVKLNVVATTTTTTP